MVASKEAQALGRGPLRVGRVAAGLLGPEVARVEQPHQGDTWAASTWALGTRHEQDQPGPGPQEPMARAGAAAGGTNVLNQEVTATRGAIERGGTGLWPGACHSLHGRSG